MQADGYTTVEATPWEAASKGKAVVCNRTTPCSLAVKLEQSTGTYNIAVQYYDLRTGVSQYELLLNHETIGHWAADAILPPATVDTKLDGSTSTRFTLHNIHLRPGDTLTLSATPGGGEPAPVDYIEITK
jgi:alpha-glucuronidase